MTIKRRYTLWAVTLLLVVASAGAIAQDRPGPAAEMNEGDLIALLLSDAPAAEKAITCKQLAIYGTDLAVPALAPLLADEALTSWARIALEAIPGPAADAALRNALENLEGRTLIGTINSIAVRRDAKAVDALAQKLNDTHAGVASAAAVALGHIGGEQASKALTQSLADARPAVRSAAAEGCILCAEGFLASDRTAAAVQLYDRVRQADLPNQRHLEAIRGAILARKSDGVPLLIEQLRSQDKNRLNAGLRTARELPGRDVTEALAVELGRLNRDRRPLLLLALADRSDAAVLPIVHKAVQDQQKDLRLTAIDILIELGEVSSIPVLLEAAITDDAELEEAAMETLVRLPGKEVDADLLARLAQASGKRKQALIELAGQRQIGAALPLVVSSLRDRDARIRGAAIETIGIIGQDEQIVDLVKLLQETRSSGERSGLRKALLAPCGRCGVRYISHLRPLTASRDSELHKIGLHAMAIMGGTDALAAVKAAMESAESPVRDEAVRILSTWPNDWPEDDEAGRALLGLAQSNEKMSHQVLGLRGYLRYLRGNKKLSNEQKVAKIEEVRSHIKRTEEMWQAIAVLGEAPSASALELLQALAEDPAVVEEAYSAMIQVAGQDIRGVSQDQRRQVLKTVAEKSKNNGTQQRARRALRRVR